MRRHASISAGRTDARVRARIVPAICGHRVGIDGETKMAHRLVRLTRIEYSIVKDIAIYDPSRLSELIRFAQVDAGSSIIDVYPGAGD